MAGMHLLEPKLPPSLPQENKKTAASMVQPRGPELRRSFGQVLLPVSEFRSMNAP